MTPLTYLRIWIAGARYSVVRTLMFRGDFVVWSLVELFWMAVNVLMIAVIYSHTSSIAGWSEYEMMLLVGTSMLIQRLLMGFFWSNFYEMGRNIRTGAFDFYLAQPGNPLLMVSTRKLDLDGLANSFLALALVIYSAHRLGLHPGALDLALYGILVLAGLVVHYSLLVLTNASTFWFKSAQGLEASYFTLAEFGRLPREAFKGIGSLVLVWLLPVVVTTNAPARTLLHGFRPDWALWLFAVAVLWLSIAVFVFNRGLRQYSSASS
jgi:ABC-2 type transport system permease protein